jgi:tRNA(fMet)-specific endonuclease VapC
MSGFDLLADTNAVIGWLKRDNALARVLLQWSIPAMSVFTLGELLYGAMKSARPAESKAQIKSVQAVFRVLHPGERTAESYASVRYQLRRKGRPIPENDLWIAALALENNLPVLTRDRHFREVESLDIVSW